MRVLLFKEALTFLPIGRSLLEERPIGRRPIVVPVLILVELEGVGEVRRLLLREAASSEHLGAKTPDEGH